MNKIIFGNKHTGKIFADIFNLKDEHNKSHSMEEFDNLYNERARVVEELQKLDLDIIKNNSKENNISDKFLIAKNNVLLAIYIKITKTLYTYKKDDEGLWIDKSVDEDIDCISIEVEDGDFPNYSFYLNE